ncbi:hypothetical protein DUNSADRAFT_8921 [Dunaliella salina]|uniref:Uncharacterized protein n=1 Tax=Dunaliella salina TaxID=3046 RepID=A0ABQ7GIK9_DUNSA|nr:hypothetical protein DUNSADRAFT_8921 [Dunaliella salina]|eukprot:KAF5834419.1 hypothetical protein DUNSADRAFT_8921 [Dunaliella salina]
MQAAAPHLEVFKATGLGGVFGWQVPSTDSNWQQSPGWPSLRVLELGTGELQGSPGISSLSNNVLLRFAGKSPKLSRLELSGCCLPGLKPDVFASLSGASQLRVLHLRRSTLACDDGLLSVAAHCPALQELDVSSSRGAVTDVGLEAIAQACHQSLRTLDLAGSAITSSGLRTVVQCCSLLEAIDLGSCRGLERGLRGNSVSKLRQSFGLRPS